jgi:UDP-N-acetyl-D-glucosamine dehydrogenase
VAYKRGIGDTRESPALEVLEDLRRKGAEISYADPYVPSLVIDGTVFEAIELTDAKLTTADCVLILTDHPEFDYRRVVARASLIVDTRNATWRIPSPAGRVVVL